MTRIISAEYIGNYDISICFDNNKQGVVNLWPVIAEDSREILKQLHDKKLFSDFIISCNTITWKNGVDISPDYLEELAKIN